MKQDSGSASALNLRTAGILDACELSECSGVPSLRRLRQGPVAVIECSEEIPCNPCEISCANGAIEVGRPITNRPMLKSDQCSGCGVCIAKCPGLAIFVVDLSAETEDIVSLPYEMLPIPQVGEIVDVLNREGNLVGPGKVAQVATSFGNDRTTVVTLAVDKGQGMHVRALRVKGAEYAQQR